MAFAPFSLRRCHETAIGLASGAQTFGRQIGFFVYATDDAAATVEAAGYWNGARAVLKVGDIVAAVMAAGGTPVLKQYVATAVPSTGNVVLALQTTTAG